MEQQLDTLSVSAVGAAFTVIMAVLFLSLPRRYAFLPLLMTILYMPMGQQLIIATLNFTMFRLMVIAGFIRIVAKREYAHVHLNAIDILLILYVASSLIIETTLWQTSERFIGALGFSYNAIGSFFLFRCLVRDYDEFRSMLKILALVMVPVAVSVVVEKVTLRNYFSLLGGVPEYATIRWERIRCQGPFRHPILAGTYGATIMPLFVTLFCKDANGNRSGILGLVGLVCATIIMLFAASSGALIAYLSGIVGLMAWYFRNHMRAIRWGIVFLVVALQLVMNSPVWYIMARIAAITGGTGWHRSELIHQWLRHFDEWWLLGTKKTSHWMGGIHLLNRPDDADITNHFIGVAIHGGLLSLILFVLIIVFSYKTLGRTLQLAKESAMYVSMTLWTLGVMVFAHIVSFTAVSYFDIIIVFWYMPLAAIASLAKADLVAQKSVGDESALDMTAI